MGKTKKKSHRNPPGTGSVYPIRGGRFCAKRPTGGRDAKGRMVYERYYSATREDAARWLHAGAPAGPSTTLADWAQRWLASLDVREQSRDNYETNLRKRILPDLGSQRVAVLTTFGINEAARKWGGQCGPATLTQTLSTLAACLRGAVEADLIPKNPAEYARKPRPAEPQFDLFTPDEMRAILAAACAAPKLYPVALCCATGCRIGEALAVEACDLDFAEGRLSIRRTVTRGKKGRPRGVGPPKSRHSKRELTVPAAARAALSAVPDTQSPRTMMSRWELLLDRLGIRRRGIHQLRHTVASHALAAGVPLVNVARDLGDSPSTILKTYAHPTPGRGVCEAMGDLFSESTEHASKSAS